MCMRDLLNQAHRELGSNSVKKKKIIRGGCDPQKNCIHQFTPPASAVTVAIKQKGFFTECASHDQCRSYCNEVWMLPHSSALFLRALCQFLENNEQLHMKCFI